MLFGILLTLAVLLAVLVVRTAYTSTPDDVTIWIDVTPLARLWRTARNLAARVAGWLW